MMHFSGHTHFLAVHIYGTASVSSMMDAGRHRHRASAVCDEDGPDGTSTSGGAGHERNETSAVSGSGRSGIVSTGRCSVSSCCGAPFRRRNDVYVNGQASRCISGTNETNR